ncbi:hypothetical protein [Photorhabdus viridis]|uniref:hypothetical protein n=1 Tax=Photorhabdus viridis TaxID=3163327 RepID=UPI003307BDC6
MDQKPSLDNSQINQALIDKLCTELGGTEYVRLALAKVNLTTKPDTENNQNQENESVIIEVSCITSVTYLPQIKYSLLKLKDSQEAIIQINGVGIVVSKENVDKLIGI